MTTVDITKAKELVARFDVNDANRFIKAGWTLVGQAHGKDESGYPLTKYELAWLGDGEPVDPQR